MNDFADWTQSVPAALHRRAVQRGELSHNPAGGFFIGHTCLLENLINSGMPSISGQPPAGWRPQNPQSEIRNWKRL